MPEPRDIREAEGSPLATMSASSATPPPASSGSVSSTPSPAPAPRRRSRWLALLSVLGPGIISAAAGNDAGGITTFSQVGATYGYTLLWCLALVTIGLIVVQEMCTRMGAVTGKGLADLIRENFGLKVTMFAMIVLLIANFAITVSEFAGIAAVGEMFLGHSARKIIVPVAMLIVWGVVSRGSYQKIERVFLIASLIFLTYIVTALKIGVPWGQVLHATFLPPLSKLPWSGDLIVMIVTLIGTTISPYMQFYQQSAVRDKGISMKDYALAKWDTILGCLLSSIVAMFIVITCAKELHGAGITHIESAGQVAVALQPLAGKYASILFAFGLLNASLMAAMVVPLSSAYAVTESLGWESGLGRRIRELPLFYGTYGALILMSGLLIMFLPAHSNLIQIILNAQIVNCALLPVELILMLILINRRRIMGHHKNSIGMNFVAWTTTVIAASLSLFLLLRQVWTAIHPV
ncbi:MAG: Nramp family divalent metal transporter [Capsulimonas sp.]|uniref:Nramp family divalent metal transporter n=1 Tax=Capsulimonas sp. TaxID=2494211 RepID=UPI0032668755